MSLLRCLMSVPLAAAIAAQDEATTLARLCDRAAAVAVVRVVHTAADGQGERVVQLRTAQALHGAPAAAFVLREPEGSACGRALTGLVPGQACIAFLAAADPAALVVPNPRALPRLEPELLAAVQALLAAGDPAARRRLAIQGLERRAERVRRDAALDLAAAPDLAQLDAAERRRVTTALEQALQDGGATLPPLLAVARRLPLADAGDRLAAEYLGARRPQLQRLLAGALLALEPVQVTTRFALATEPAQRLRAIELLARMPALEAERLLGAWLDAAEPQVARRAAATLLARGHREDLLRARHPSLPDDLRPAVDRRPRFRAVQPEVPQ